MPLGKSILQHAVIFLFRATKNCTISTVKTLSRVLLVLALIWLGVVFFLHATANNADPSAVILMFAGVILVGLAVGVIAALIFMPAFGDVIGNFFFNPDEKVEKDPHATAMARMAQGNYQEAVEEYHKAFARDPHDTLSLSEIAHIYCDKLKNPEAARSLLEDALDRDWPIEEAAFLLNRLVDVCWKYQHDLGVSRALLLKIVEQMPGTKHAANAQHRLREIEHAPLHH